MEDGLEKHKTGGKEIKHLEAELLGSELYWPLWRQRRGNLKDTFDVQLTVYEK
jgi:hypothetical protein